MAEMAEEAAMRDAERAALYLPTVRPAWAATRFVREERERQERTNEQPATEDGSDRRPTGEGAKVVATMDAEAAADPESPDCGSTVAVSESESTGVVMKVATVTLDEEKAANPDDVDDEMKSSKTQVANRGESSEEDGGNSPGDSGGEVTRTRRERRRARKTAKQRKLRAKQAAVRNATRDNVEERERRANAQREEREQQATKALVVLEERRQQRISEDVNSGTQAKNLARVSLTKQRRVPSGIDDDALEQVGAEDGLPTANLTVDGVRKEVKLDSCARYSIAGTDWMAHGDKVANVAPVDYVEGIGGFLLDVVGVWSFEFRNVYDELISVEALVVSGCTDEFLLGVDFMQSRGATMDFGRNEVRYNDNGRVVVIPFRTTDKQGGRKVAAVRIAGKARLTARTVTPVAVSVTAKDGERGLFIPTRSTGAVMLAATVTTARGGKAWVPAINANDRAANLPNKRELGTWIPVDDDMTILAMNDGLGTKRLTDWMSKLGDSKTPLKNESDVKVGIKDQEARELVLKLLRVYRGLSADESDCPPATALNIHHHIDTGETAPIMLKRRRQAQTEDEVIEENVEKMLRAGVIEEGDGAWGFPVVLVRKKDGEIRFCIDYRALNKVTKKDVYPLPRIDETLEALGGALLFTTLDLKAGYWQILVAPEDRDKTAFTTKRGLYRFVRMPFGLTNAPSTFQRMMNHVLRGLTWSTCLVYLDDIIIFTRGGIERHVVELATVLERLSMAGLTLKLKKCSFAMRSMEYLGHELSNEGVRPVERLITAVREFPKPRDAHEVKRFVHLAGYYRRFVEGFGSIMAPMTKLLRKKVVWEWTAKQDEAFEKVKAILTSKPLLIYPDFRLPFRVVTDASVVGLGACLMQDQGKGWQPVAYASKVNSETESKYGITELECLAVVWAVKLFRPYLYGRQFAIITDHSALRWLMTSANLTGKLHRWALTLQEFDFVVEYRPGSTNVVADALSRAPTIGVMRAAVGKRRRSKRRTAKQGQSRAAQYAADGGPTGAAEEGTSVDGVASETGATAGSVDAQDEDEKPVETVMKTGSGDAVAGRDRRRRRKATAVPAVDQRVTRATTRKEGERQWQAEAERALRDFAMDEKTDGVAVTAPVNGATAAHERAMLEATTEATTGRGAEVTCGTTPVRNEADVDYGDAVLVTDADDLIASGESVSQAETGADVVHDGTADAHGRTAQDETRNNTVADVSVDRQRATAEADGTAANRTDAVPGVQSDERQRANVATRGADPVRVPAAIVDDSALVSETVAGSLQTSDETAVAQLASGDQYEKESTVDATSSGTIVTGATDVQDGDHRRRRAAEVERRRITEQTLQVTDDEIQEEQAKSRLVQRLLSEGEYRGQKVSKVFGLVLIETVKGQRVILPPALWAVVFKECHDSVWAGHLRAPHTYARIAATYWWPGLQNEVKKWVRGCRECGSRKARPREVVPPLRSIRGGDVGDRWALDVAGPLPASDGGKRYVIAAVEYVTRYVVATTVDRHVAENVAEFLMKDVVLKFGPFRELLTDGAPELTGKVIEELVAMLQARQTNPVPYRPQMIGLVERFNRTWKDIVATFMQDEEQRDWERWVSFAVYSYNSGRHSTVALSPNELMLGRRLKSPNELLRTTGRTEAGELSAYHQKLVATLRRSHECAEKARTREQQRQARHYDRQVKRRRTFRTNDRVWMYRPPRGPKATKLAHQWMGPLRIIEAVGYDNYLLEREDTEGDGEQIIAHVSVLVSYHYPEDFLSAAAKDIANELQYENGETDDNARPANSETGRATKAPVREATGTGGQKRRRRTVAREKTGEQQNEPLVELRRRRRRNAAGQYILEFELQPEREVRRRSTGSVSGEHNGRRWVSVDEYERLFKDGRVVEDPKCGEGV